MDLKTPLPPIFLSYLKKSKDIDQDYDDDSYYSDTKTFTTFCNDKVSLKPTDAWLLTHELRYHMASKLVEAHMNGYNFVVKVRNLDDKALIEAKNFKKINEIKHPNFAKLICQFECFDDILKYNRRSELPKGFCNGGYNSVQISVMPYYKIGNLENNIEHLDDSLLMSLIGQIIMASVEMFQLCGFVHNDLIMANIFIKKKKLESISNLQYHYQNKKKQEATYYVKYLGFLAIIGDFDVSSFNYKEMPVVKQILALIEKIYVERSPSGMSPFVKNMDKIITNVDLLIEFALDLGYISK